MWKNTLSSLLQNYYYILHMQFLLFSVYFTVVLYSSLFLISWPLNIVSLPTQDVITAALLYLFIFHIFIWKQIFEHEMIYTLKLQHPENNEILYFEILEFYSKVPPSTGYLKFTVQTTFQMLKLNQRTRSKRTLFFFVMFRGLQWRFS